MGIDFDGDGVIRPNDIAELVNRITGVTGRNKLGDEEVKRNRLEDNEMDKVIKHVSYSNMYSFRKISFEYIIST